MTRSNGHRVGKFTGTRWYACPDCGTARRALINPNVICENCGARCRRGTLGGKVKEKRKRNNRATRLMVV